MGDHFDTYLRALDQAHVQGQATEHTYRPALKALLEAHRAGVTATNEPKRVACGAPDFVIETGRAHNRLIVGYAETKDLDANLDEVERSDQLQRYRAALPNLLLTNYIDFRWYVDGERRLTARLARVGAKGRVQGETDGAYDVGVLLDNFLASEPLKIGKAKDLALRMARLTHLIRDVIVRAFEEDHASDSLKDLRRAFAKALIPDLMEPDKTPEFADMYAQTLAYGLFAARCFDKSPENFSRDEARHLIPRTNPFLRRLFDMISGAEMDQEPYAGFVDDLVQLLGLARMDQVLADFGRRAARQDPVVHFYETFLAAYDPKLRKSRGVYYTPEPVVSYIVRSVDLLLKSRFGCPAGLADTQTVAYNKRDEIGAGFLTRTPRVLVLDPACGTGTFLYAAVDHIRERFMASGNAGLWSGYVRDHILPRFFGFELLMAPYAVAHFKLGMELAGLDLADAARPQWAYDFASDERLGIYLTNTLEETAKRTETLFGPLRVITEEAEAASLVKGQLPIMVVMGNPPYAGHSANASARTESYVTRGGKLSRRKVDTFIGRLLKDYYKVDGKPLGEKNPKWLQDDYVKFIRFGQWRIQQTGSGVLAFITNHGYLDNPTFRGMRQSLMKTFDEIYLLDLHGNSKKKERAPGGGPDKNVFDIQQGVAIALMVKHPASTDVADKPAAKVRHAELWGPREGKDGTGGKYGWLAEKDVESTPWQELKPEGPFYLFVPQDAGLKAEYEKGWKITEIFPVNVLGFQTHRDGFATDIDREALVARMLEMRDSGISDDAYRNNYRVGDSKEWKLSDARRLIRSIPNWNSSIVPCQYRPFDSRWCFLHEAATDRPRRELLDHVAHRNNLCLNVVRQTRAASWQHAVVSNAPTPALFVEIKDGSNVFPLYCYPSPGVAGPGRDPRTPNLSAAAAALLKDRGLTPEDLFHYIYAVFHSPAYRSRYAEFLKTDFPRVPVTSDPDLFRALAAKGAELVALHLLESPRLSPTLCSFPAAGSNLVERGFPTYLPPGALDAKTGAPIATGRVHINPGQYFDAVPQEIWTFPIGGYQVAQKWLKDRQGRTLSYDDLTHYQKTLTALHHTRRLMQDIDALIPTWPVK